MQKYIVTGQCRYVGRLNGEQVEGTAVGQATFYAMNHDQGFIEDTAVLAMSDRPKLARVNDEIKDIHITGFVIWGIVPAAD